MTKRARDQRFFCPEVTRSIPTFAASRGLAAACVVGSPSRGAARMGHRDHHPPRYRGCPAKVDSALQYGAGFAMS